MIEERLKKLIEIIIQQANEVEKMLNNCHEGLINKNKGLLLKIINIDENKINKMEIKIDEFYTNIFALYKPEAKDLRTVLMISKMNIDLERIGDHCVNIAESILYLLEKKALNSLNNISKMFEITKQMLKESINTFPAGNTDAALNICKRDADVDTLNEKIFNELVKEMLADTSIIENLLHFLRIANNLEKIADLATNICEETIYIESGRVIKHHKSDEK